MKVLTAMSGGVDSSVAAYLMKQKGHEVSGAMMKLLDEINADDAQSVANALNIPFYILDFAKEFSENVTEKFIQAYQNGITPNPCIICNRYMKFGKFSDAAKKLDCDYIATGHYAKISKEPCGRFLLKSGKDKQKDQSYFLYTLTQEKLSRIFFPLGELEKEEVREIALSQNFINAKKRDSQDICFVPNGDHADYIQRNAASESGNFIDSSGKILGRHKGVIFYTIGQRKGLGISAPEPLYVTKIDAQENTVTLGVSEELFTKTLTADDINLIATDRISGALNVQAKIRYAHKPQAATIKQTEENKIFVEFNEPQRAVTPGQAVVFYNDDVVVGGGTIE